MVVSDGLLDVVTLSCCIYQRETLLNTQFIKFLRKIMLGIYS